MSELPGPTGQCWPDPGAKEFCTKLKQLDRKYGTSATNPLHHDRLCWTTHTEENWMDYNVMISCTFEADGPEDAVRQMVAYLLDNAAQAGYRVESETNESYISVFIDAENLEVY